MLNKNNLMIAKVASQDGESKFSISGVLIERGATVVTDGHLMLVVETPDPKGEGFPKFDGKVLVTEDFKPFVVPAKTALEIVKAIPKSKTPIVENAFVLAADDEKSEIGVTDLETERVFRVKADGGIYPNWRAVVNRTASTPVIETCFEVKQLLNAVTMLKDLGIVHATLRVQGSQDAVRFDGVNNDTIQHVTAVLMPVRINHEARYWTGPVAPAPARDIETLPGIPEGS